MLVVALLWCAALLDFLSLSALLPLLHALTGSSAQSGAARWLAKGLELLALPLTLPVLLTVIVTLVLGKAGLRWLAMSQVSGAVVGAAHDLRTKLHEAMMAASWRFFVQTPAGHLASAATVEAYRAAFAYRRACSALAALLQLLFTVALVLLISVWAGVLALLLGGTVALLLRTIVRASRKAGYAQTDATRMLSARVTDLARALKPARGMGRDTEFGQWLNRDSLALRRAELLQLRANEALQAAQEPLAALAVAGTLLVTFTLTGQAAATLLLLGLLFYRVLQQVNLVQLEYQGLVWGESAFHALHNQIEAARQLREARAEQAVHATPAFKRELTVIDVTFAYERAPVLQRFSLSVAVGAFVLIRGPSGAGKTTLLDLLAGLYTPASGQILIDGRPLSQIQLHDWRRKIGYVTQEPALLHASVRDNLTLGETLAEEQLWAVLERARAAEFVAALPAGLNTIVGEQGYRLSGGQRQRLALARALAGQPALLLLDEPTANVDAATQDALVESLLELKRLCTILVVSHQPALAGIADSVVELAAAPARRPAPVVPAGM
jgi:ATP-binding cassette subfamily C protein